MKNVSVSVCLNVYFALVPFNLKEAFLKTQITEVSNLVSVVKSLLKCCFNFQLAKQGTFFENLNSSIIQCLLLNSLPMDVK